MRLTGILGERTFEFLVLGLGITSVLIVLPLQVESWARMAIVISVMTGMTVLSTAAFAGAIRWIEALHDRPINVVRRQVKQALKTALQEQVVATKVKE